MPRKGGRKGGGSRDSATMAFHSCINGTLVSGLTSVGLAPSSFARVLVEADVWALFRVRKLAFRLLPTSPSTVAQAGGYIGAIQDGPPATFAQIVELLPSCIKGVGQTVPTSWVHISKSELAGPFPWYKTIAGTPDATEESPGTIYVVGTGTETVTVEFKGVFEFKTGVNSANTPLALRLREEMRSERLNLVRERERNTLLRILAPPGLERKTG